MWYLLTWLQPLVVVAGFGLAGVAGIDAPGWRAGALVQAAVVLLSAVGLVVYVAGEDDYRGQGITRWEAYDAQELTVAATATGAAAALGLVAAAAAGRRRLGIPACVVSSGAGVLAFVAFFANSLN